MSTKLEHFLPFTIKTLTTATVSLPLFSFAFCIFWSFIFDLEEATKTHCSVDNFAPSISAAIGNFLPQKYVWQAAISLHITPRFVFMLMYKNFYATRIPNLTARTRILIQTAIGFNFLELVSLLGLTLVSSDENFDIHKVCFVAFGISGLIYFILTYLLWTKYGLELETNEEIKSLRIKKRTLKFYFVCGCLMSFFYYRHNEYCEPYVYSFFCICEYVIVISNMMFHYTARYDFAHINLVLPARISQKGYLPMTAH